MYCGTILHLHCTCLFLTNRIVFQKRNKPVEPPKQPKAAPFFLPTLSGLVPKFVTGGDEGDIPDEEAAASKIINLGKLEPLSEFQRSLEDCYSTYDCEQTNSVYSGTSDKELSEIGTTKDTCFNPMLIL